MEFRIADKFQDSLGRLTGEEQKAVKITVSDIQLNPENPGLKYHRLNKAKDKNFWSVRVSRDVRLILHRTPGGTLICFVGHHDDAYDWAERRKIETHPKTGAAQLVEIRETVREIEVPVMVPAAQPRASESSSRSKDDEPIFGSIPDDDLLSYGVPEEWLADVRVAIDETALEALADHLPAEASEALWDLATGGTPAVPVQAPQDDPFDHPDAKRRFYLVNTVEELQRALDYPWDKWTIFLHPDQQSLVSRAFNGPARVAGSAGTGKTVVAMHRTVHLARANPKARILLTTFNDPLAASLRGNLTRLLKGEDQIRDRIAVETLDGVATSILGEAGLDQQLVSQEEVSALIAEASGQGEAHRFTQHFLESEWSEVVDEWQLTSWEEYRSVPRLGRKTGLAEKQREILWQIFDRVMVELEQRHKLTMAQIQTRAVENLRAGTATPFEYVVVDEAQDISVPQLRLLAEIAGGKPDGLFLAGDLGQRIFQTPFSWKSLGVDVRGRSRTLRINYRTSHEIRRYADRLLPPALSDVDGNQESRNKTISVFSGAQPRIELFESSEQEKERVAVWLTSLGQAGFQSDEIGVFVRSSAELRRALDAVEIAGLDSWQVDAESMGESGSVAVGIMELTKGLEFRAVAVMACDDVVIPSQKRIDEIGDYADLEDVWETERQLLYVACTRARDELLVTAVEPGSEYLEDLVGPGENRA